MENARFDNVIQSFLETEPERVGKSSYLEYHRVINRFIEPALGKIPSAQMNNAVVRDFIEDLSSGREEKPLSNATIRHIYTILRIVIRYGWDTQMLPVFRLSVRLPGKTRRESRCFDEKQIPGLVTYLKSQKTARAYGAILCLYTGLRVGELCALRWGDIDLSEGVLHVRRTVKRVENPDPSNGEGRYLWVIGLPKTQTSYRDVPLMDELWSDLSGMRGNLPDDAYFLNGRTDRFVYPRSFERSFGSWLDRTGLPRINVHSMRHSFATRCLENGSDIKTVSEIMGHASTTITMNLYVHTSMQRKRDAVNRLACGNGSHERRRSAGRIAGRP